MTKIVRSSPNSTQLIIMSKSTDFITKTKLFKFAWNTRNTCECMSRGIQSKLSNYQTTPTLLGSRFPCFSNSPNDWKDMVVHHFYNCCLSK